MELDQRERFLIAAASLIGREPDAPTEDITANCGKILAQALVWAGLWTEEMRPHMQFGYDVVDPIVEDWYGTLIAMTQRTPQTDQLLEGWGNLGSPVGDPPAAPTFTACRLTKKGWALAKRILAKNQLELQPPEFFRCL